MRVACIVCSGIVTCAIGGVIGVAIAEINRGDRNPQAHTDYALIGSVLGFVVGSAQEAIRQKAREEME